MLSGAQTSILAPCGKMDTWRITHTQKQRHQQQTLGAEEQCQMTDLALQCSSRRLQVLSREGQKMPGFWNKGQGCKQAELVGKGRANEADTCAAASLMQLPLILAACPSFSGQELEEPCPGIDQLRDVSSWQLDCPVREANWTLQGESHPSKVLIAPLNSCWLHFQTEMGGSEMPDT